MHGMMKEEKVQSRSWQHYEQRNKLERNWKEKTVGKYKKLEIFFLSITLCKAETVQKRGRGRRDEKFSICIYFICAYNV